MNKIFKVIYSKTRHCYVVVSELAKSHCKTTQSHTARSKTALTAAVLLALGAFSFVGMPVVQAADGTESLRNNDFVGANDQYWYYDEGDKEWKTYQYKLTSAFNNRARGKLPNYQGGGAKFPGAVTAGLYAQAGQQTVTIGDRNAGQSKGSVFIGEHSGYNNGNNDPAGMKNNYVTSVGFQSDATGWGSIAIGSNATAENSKMESQVVEEVGNANTSGTVSDDTYGIKENPTIQGASVALGYNAHSKDGNIAIGAYSDATTDLSDDTSDKAKSYLTKNNATSYVSVGSKDVQRRISNVADGAADSDAATIAQLKEAVKATDASKKANIDASNIGKNLKFKADGKTAADSSDITTNENDWGTAIGTGKVEDKNGQLVTGGTVYNALQQQADNLKVNAGWGINVADENDPTNTGKKTKNVISLKHNLGTGYNDDEANGMIIGGLVEDRDPAKQYGAADANSVIVGAGKALASGKSSVVVGGLDNVASGATSVVVGGDNNNAAGNQSAVFGGRDNKAAGIASTASGGIMNAAVGQQATAIGGSNNYVLGANATAVGGLGRGYANGEVVYDSAVRGSSSVGIAGGSTGEKAIGALAAGHQAVVTTENGTAIGYQATTDEANTIAFGHDADDVSGYTIEWNKLPENQVNADGTTNDYTKAPKSITPTTYKDAYYNRLVKVADGQDDHDVVVMEQLKQYANKDALNIGSNIKVYKTDGKGNVQVEDKDATTNAQNANKNAWGKALGAEKFSKGTTTTATNASTSDQLVTGKTLYNYDAPVAETGKKLNYVSANNTTGQNLSALDAQVADNASKLNGKTHNIKYYSVSDNAPTLGFDSYSNAGNDGAKGRGSLAAGFVTHADGIASTVAGSYSGVINSGNAQGRDLRGAAALSYGTFNVNQNTDTAKEHSGVANSIVGQANMTTNSNAAIIYGAGNTVTDSYRPIADKASAILGNVSDPKKLSKAMQDAVKESGGQVMVMGGGNNVESAYMSQVTGVGNTVKGNQVENDKGEWVTDTSKTAIKDYNSEKSSQYNYVDGFSNEVINGKHDYVIGANNKLSGDSYDDDKAKPIKRSNKSNIVIGDNHTLTRKQNTVIIGSSDTENTQTIARDAVIIGHNANATSDTGADNAVAIGLSATATGGNAVTIGVNTSAGENSITIGSESSAISGQNIAIGRYAKVDGYEVTKAVALGQKAEAQVADGVAIGSNSIATVAGNSVEGYDPTTGQDSTDGTATWKANNAAVSIGKADGTVTRQINGVAAGTNDTDAVNVAQLKKLEGMKANVDASNIGANLKGSDGKTAASASDITANEDAWGTAIGTGTIASTSGQLVTGKTVYGEVRPTADGTYIKTANTTAANLTALDTQVGTNTGDITNLKDLSNISNKGETVIKNLAKNTVKVKAGERVTVTDKTDSTTGAITYTVSANNNGAVAAGDTNLVSGDTVNTAITNAINNAGTATDTKLAGKANVDASNIGANLKGSDGKTAASASDITANEDAWGTAIGTGTIASTSGQLVTGKTVYSEVRPSADGTYIKTANTTAANLTALDTQVGRNTTNISNLQNGEGFTDKGNTYIKNLAKGSIGMENGSHTTVSHRDANGVETYKVDVNVDGKVESGNKGIVDGGAVYSAIQDVKNQTSADLANKANVDASNLTPNNVTKWQEKLGNGKVESGNTGLVTGDTVFKAVDTKANRDGSNLTDKEADSFSEKIARGEVKAGENRAVSGDAVSQAISKVTGDMNTKLDGKANTSLDNITKDGQTVIKKLSQDAVQVKAGDDHITVDAKTDETTGNKTYTISAKDGKVASGDTGLISGGTLYNEVHVDKDGSYIKSGNTVGNNLSALDTGLKNTSSLIHTNTSGDTIHIGETSKATKVDVSSTDANGNKNGRVVTGVVTDAKDANSAANVGYVNGVTAANTQQIYRDMNNAYSRLDTNINRAAAGSNALAALHPLDFDPADKASFAVGYGHYRNANAAAVGAFYQPNANTMVNMGISLGNGDPGFNAGVSFKIGKDSTYNGVSKAEMAQTIHDQATEISAIKADDAAKDKRIDALEKENQEMKKQIQEILARLNG